MTRRASSRAVCAAIGFCAIMLGVERGATQSPELDTASAVAALEACLNENRTAPVKCTRMAEPFCAELKALECRRFQIIAWRRLADEASAKMAAALDGPVDQSFAQSAAEDLSALQDAACDAAAEKSVLAEREKTRLDCLLRRAAARGAAFWLVAADV